MSQEELEPKERENDSRRNFCHCFCRKGEFTTTGEEGGGLLESVHVIWAPQSLLTSAPAQATCRSLPAGAELSMASVTLGHGGGGWQWIAASQRLQRSSEQSPSLLPPPNSCTEGDEGFRASHLLRPQSHQVLSPVGPWSSLTLALLRSSATGVGIVLSAS